MSPHTRPRTARDVDSVAVIATWMGRFCPLTGCAGVRLRVHSRPGTTRLWCDLYAPRPDQGVGHRTHRAGLLRRCTRDRGRCGRAASR
jgi:hypothetical protein